MGKLKRRDGAANLTAMKIDDFNLETRQGEFMIGYTLSLRSISTENQRISPQDEIPKERGTHSGSRVYSTGRWILL